MEENVRKKVTEHKEKSTALVPVNYVVPEEQKKLALAKYDLIKKWDKFRNEKNNKTIAGKDFLDGYKCICEELFDVIGKVAIGTIYEWHKKLHDYNDDWHCLINNYTFGEKTKKTKMHLEEEAEFLKNLLHPSQLNIGKATKLTKMTLLERGFTNLCCDLTYRRFAENYKREHYNTWVDAREGNKALHDKVLPFIKRDISKIEVGDVIIGDGHRLAFFVKHPYTGKGEKIEPSRMHTVTKIMIMLKNVKIYEDKLTSEKHMPDVTRPEGLTPEVIREIEEKILGITYED